MNRKLLLIWLTVLVISLGSENKIKAQPGVAVSFSVFYDQLSPYGSWINDAQYGYVWVPNVAVGFQPYYTNGYWVQTEYGNTWVSSYAWGWAPFHYGRWVYDAFYGWVWVPGYNWGPAWVYWRYGGGYYGWAPLTPGFVVGVSIGAYTCPMDWWVFLPPKYLYRRNFTYHVRDRRNNLNVYNQTTIINNTYVNPQRKTTYITGPTRDNYREVSGKEVTIHRVSDLGTRTATYTRDNTVHIYRPEINREATPTAPRNVTPATRPVREAVPMSTNDYRESPFTREVQPNRTPTQRAEPAQRVPQPVQRTPRTPQRTEPVQKTPQQTQPVQRTPRTPQRTEPAQRTPSTQPVRREPPQRTTQPVRRDQQPSRNR